MVKYLTETIPPTCHNLPMCGRYRLSRRKQIIEKYFDTASADDDWTPRYNIAPTQSIPVILQNPKEPVREMSLMRWGLIPSWAKDTSAAARMINARADASFRRTGFASGNGRTSRNSHTVLKSVTGRCSHSRDCGTAGKTLVDSGSSPVRS